MSTFVYRRLSDLQGTNLNLTVQEDGDHLAQGPVLSVSRGKITIRDTKLETERVIPLGNDPDYDPERRTLNVEPFLRD